MLLKKQVINEIKANSTNLKPVEKKKEVEKETIELTVKDEDEPMYDLTAADEVSSQMLPNNLTLPNLQYQCQTEFHSYTTLKKQLKLNLYIIFWSVKNVPKEQNSNLNMTIAFS